MAGDPNPESGSKEFVFTIFNSLLAQTVELVASPILTYRNILELKVPLEVINTLFELNNNRYVFRYNNFIQFINFTRGQLLNGNVGSLEVDALKYNAEQANISLKDVSNSTEWTTAFRIAAQTALTNLDLLCQSFDATTGDDSELITDQDGVKYFPTSSTKNLAYIVAQGRPPSTPFFDNEPQISPIPILLQEGDKIVFDMNTTFTQSNPDVTISPVKYRIKLVCTSEANLTSPIDLSATALQTILGQTSYPTINTVTQIVTLNPNGTWCSLNNIDYPSEGVGQLDNIIDFYRNYGIYISWFKNDYYYLTSVETVRINPYTPQYGELSKVSYFSQTEMANGPVQMLSSIVKKMSYIVTMAQLPVPQPRPEILSNAPYQVRAYNSTVVLTSSSNTFYVTDNGVAKSDGYGFYDFDEVTPVFGKSFGDMTGLNVNDQFTPQIIITFPQPFDFVGSDIHITINTESDTIQWSPNLNFADINAIIANLQNFVSYVNESNPNLLQNVQVYKYDDTSMMICLSNLVSASANSTIGVTLTTGPYPAHQRLVSTVPLLDLQVPSGDNNYFNVLAFPNLIVPEGVYTVYQAANFFNEYLTGYRAYVTDKWFLILEKATPFSDQDVFNGSWNGLFGLLGTSSAWP